MIKMSQTTTGISAILTGFNKENVSAKIAACQEGSCECACDPEVMHKIDNIEISGDSSVTTINISGNIDADTIAPMMQECLLGQ